METEEEKAAREEARAKKEMRANDMRLESMKHIMEEPEDWDADDWAYFTQRTER